MVRSGLGRSWVGVWPEVDRLDLTSPRPDSDLPPTQLRPNPDQFLNSSRTLPERVPSGGDLVIFYVVDDGYDFGMLFKRDLPKHLTEEELHQIAVNNLERDIEYKLHETNFGGYGLIAGGNHEAGAICLPGIWNWLSEHIDNDLIVAVPAKDLVMMVPANDTDKISNLKIAVYETFKNGQRLLTKTSSFLIKNLKNGNY